MRSIVAIPHVCLEPNKYREPVDKLHFLALDDILKHDTLIVPLARADVEKVGRYLTATVSQTSRIQMDERQIDFWRFLHQRLLSRTFKGSGSGEVDCSLAAFFAQQIRQTIRGAAVNVAKLSEDLRASGVRNPLTALQDAFNDSTPSLKELSLSRVTPQTLRHIGFSQMLIYQLGSRPQDGWSFAGKLLAGHKASARPLPGAGLAFPFDIEGRRCSVLFLAESEPEPEPEPESEPEPEPESESEQET